MNNKRHFCITFAGCIGSSKTPIANFLSCKFNLPVFNTDAIRTEVIEDLGFLDEDIYIQKRNDLLKQLLESGISFICDVSQDREWSNFKKRLLEYKYDFFIISINLSKEKLVDLYNKKGYTESLLRLDNLINDHNKFIKENIKDIGLIITDSNFNNRKLMSFSAIKSYLKDK
jgi:adenylylsulfate kinase-like enzyme